MQFAAHLLKWLDFFADCVGYGLSLLVLVLVVAVFGVVVRRYGLQLDTTLWQEIGQYAHATLFMGALAYTLRRDGHVRVDVFYRPARPTIKAAINLLGTLLFMLPFCVFMLLMNWEYVANSWALMERSREAGGLPYVYLLKTLLLIAPILLIIQAIAEILRALLALFGRPEIYSQPEGN